MQKSKVYEEFELNIPNLVLSFLGHVLTSLVHQCSRIGWLGMGGVGNGNTEQEGFGKVPLCACLLLTFAMVCIMFQFPIHVRRFCVELMNNVKLT